MLFVFFFFFFFAGARRPQWRPQRDLCLCNVFPRAPSVKKVFFSSFAFFKITFPKTTGQDCVDCRFPFPGPFAHVRACGASNANGNRDGRSYPRAQGCSFNARHRYCRRGAKAPEGPDCAGITSGRAAATDPIRDSESCRSNVILVCCCIVSTDSCRKQWRRHTCFHHGLASCRA